MFFFQKQLLVLWKPPRNFPRIGQPQPLPTIPYLIAQTLRSSAMAG